jgi:hypothetical protein
VVWPKRNPLIIFRQKVKKLLSTGKEAVINPIKKGWLMQHPAADKSNEAAQYDIE